ncbi:gene transfer agent family protein [Enterovirga aerilata]|uniref:Gene transfer agent family protein n=1 Tax=Enterovirga aerilata TaxID=2730920 RepID=A0A849IF35_9HYPH|nr:gene transfer agent family protein [Enterovirga sp. DB1703]NNM75059.1 gene transfer agent family protein [Enterovirga sp. DB1703]
MGVQTDITLAWGDGTYRFHLAIPQLKELQEKCASGPAEVLQRLVTGRARVEDAQETVRLGLVGGGTAPPEAVRLCSLYVDARPLVESIGVATLVLGAALMGHDPEAAQGNGAAARPKKARAKPSSTSRRSKRAPS